MGTEQNPTPAPEVEPCPYRHSPDFDDPTCLAYDPVEGKVCCIVCGAEGPNMFSDNDGESAAIEAWNAVSRLRAASATIQSLSPSNTQQENP